MATGQDTLPEGTDSIIGGASADETRERAESFAAGVGEAAGRWREEAAGLTGQAAAKARSYAEQGKDKATDALDGLSKAVGEVAATVDQNIGPQYGDYARRASDAVAALASDLRDKSLDEIYEDAQKMVRSSPAIAIGTAAAVGFALVRLMKSGAAAAESAATPPPRSASTTPSGGAAGSKTKSTPRAAKKTAKPAS